MMGISEALRSLEGLATGDAFGAAHGELHNDRFSTELPPATWRWTDDTHMAISVVENLVQHGGIDQDSLAAAFSKRYLAEPYRGYSSQTGGLLTEVVSGMDWRTAVFLNHPSGSYGNGPASAHYCHRPVIRSE